MMLTSAGMASFYHATIAAYVAWSLLRGATTDGRRRLGLSFAFFTSYSIAIGVGYSAKGHPAFASFAFTLCLGLAILSTLQFAELARALVLDARGARVSRGVRAGVVVVTIATLGTDGALALAGKDSPLPYAILALLSLASILTAFGFCVAGARRNPLSRALAAAALLPLVPSVLDLLNVVGFAIPLYRYTRDVSLLLYCFLSLTAYMDHGAEPMSVRRRFLAGLLTSVLGVVACSSEWAISRIHGDGAEKALLEHRMALGFAVVGALATVVTLVVFPRMVRRSVLVPLDRLAAAARAIEAGESAHADVAQHDELGETARAFNGMVDALATNQRSLEEKVVALEKRNVEVASLNAELRRQVAARSRQLQDAIREIEGPKSSVRIGALVGDRYRVIRELGGGGMGVVFEVEDEIEKRRRALKVIAGSTSPSDMVRFAREAEIAASVHHANVVPVVDVGVHEGAPFLVMELVGGGSLEASRARFGDVAWALPIVGQVAAALSELHARGVVHRDLKPANILLEVDAGRVVARVTDFGIARHDVDVFAATAAPGSDGRGVTATGMMIGTLPYMAPESLRGIRDASGKVDVFALGLIAFELVLGKYPFALPPVLEAMAGRELPSPPGLPESLPPGVREVLARCLAANPDARPTAAEVTRALELARV